MCFKESVRHKSHRVTKVHLADKDLAVFVLQQVHSHRAFIARRHIEPQPLTYGILYTSGQLQPLSDFIVVQQDVAAVYAALRFEK